MAKRDAESEAMDEELVETDVPTVGERLRAAREEKKLSLEDIAAQTRIPQRHLESIEDGDWDKLPAPTYTIGFAKSYASAVGLDRTEIGDQLRDEMGGQRFAPPQPRSVRARRSGADHAQMAGVRRDRRGHPRSSLVMSWLNKRSLDAARRDVNASRGRRRRQPRPRRHRRSAGRGQATGRADRHRAGVAPGQREGRRDPVFRACCSRARPTRCPPPRPRRCSRPASPKRCRITVGNDGRAAGRAAGQDGHQCQPAAGRPDARRAAPAAAPAAASAAAPRPRPRSHRPRSPSAAANRSGAPAPKRRRRPNTTG